MLIYWTIILKNVWFVSIFSYYKQYCTDYFGGINFYLYLCLFSGELFLEGEVVDPRV